MCQCWCWALDDWKIPSFINPMPMTWYWHCITPFFSKMGSGSAKQAKINPSISRLFCYYVRPKAQRVYHIL